MDWHPKGNVLVAGGADGTVWVWNRSSLFSSAPFFLLLTSPFLLNRSTVPRGDTLHVLAVHTTPCTTGRFTPDGKKILTASEDSMLILWDPRTGTPIWKLTSDDARFALDGGINCLAINPASTVAILGGAGGSMRAISLTKGEVLAQIQGHEDGASVEAVAFNEIPTTANGGASVQVVVSVGTDGRVCTWEANGFKLRTTGAHEVRLFTFLSSSLFLPY